MKQCLERLYNGIIKENPTFVLMLGMCPTLAVTTSAINGLGMGISTMVVLALSNLMISAMRKMIPDKVRIPAYIVIIATFVTLVELLLHAYVPSLHESLGIYISLIVVNCIILGRAESYASKNKMLPSLFDGIGMGLGFTLALTLIGLVREFLGAGTLFGFSCSDIFGATLPELLVGLINQWLDPYSTSETVQFWNRLLTDEIGSFGPVGIMVMAPGAFFILAILTAIQNVMKEKGKKAGKDVSKIQSGCNSDCMNCNDSDCSKRMIEEEVMHSVQVEITVSATEESIEEEPVTKAAEEGAPEKSASKDAEESVPEESAAKETEESTPKESTSKDAEESVPEESAAKETEESTPEESASKDAEVSVPEESAGKTKKKRASKKSASKAAEESVSEEAAQKEENSTESANVNEKKEKKRKKTLLEATQEIDIVELEELLGEDKKEEGEAK